MKKTKKKSELFHVSQRGFGSSTWCGIFIPTLDQQRVSKKKGPNWGSSHPYKATTCVACVMAYIEYQQGLMNDAIKLLIDLEKPK